MRGPCLVFLAVFLAGAYLDNIHNPGDTCRAIFSFPKCFNARLTPLVALSRLLSDIDMHAIRISSTLIGSPCCNMR